MFDSCKCMECQRAKQVHESERYLGNNSFEDELHHSVDDFLTIVRTVFDFWPYKIGEECPALSPIEMEGLSLVFVTM
jgi:hypothetical protein